MSFPVQLPAAGLTLANADIWCCRPQLGQSKIIKWRTLQRTYQSSPFRGYLSDSSVIWTFLSRLDWNRRDPCPDILTQNAGLYSPHISVKKISFISGYCRCDDSWRLGEAAGSLPHPATCLSGGQTTNKGRQGLHTFLLLESTRVFNFKAKGARGRLLGWAVGDYDQDRARARHQLTLAWCPWQGPTCCIAMSHARTAFPFPTLNAAPLTSVSHIRMITQFQSIVAFVFWRWFAARVSYHD